MFENNDIEEIYYIFEHIYAQNTDLILHNTKVHLTQKQVKRVHFVWNTCTIMTHIECS